MRVKILAGCEKSKSIVNSGWMQPCKGQLIFEDDFRNTSVNEDKWFIEEYIPKKSEVRSSCNHLKLYANYKYNPLFNYIIFFKRIWSSSPIETTTKLSPSKNPL